jgi:PAS domain-containing protein
MARRGVIEQAKGVLMQRYGIGDEAAFARLVALSQSTNIKLVQIAADILASTVGPATEAPDHPLDAGKATRWIDRAIGAFTDPALVVSPIPTDRGSVADFRIDHANQSAAVLLGRSRDDLVGTSLAEIFPERRARPDTDGVLAAASGAGAVLVNACRRTLTGTEPLVVAWPAGRILITRFRPVLLLTWQLSGRPRSGPAVLAATDRTTQP